MCWSSERFSVKLHCTFTGNICGCLLCLIIHRDDKNVAQDLEVIFCLKTVKKNESFQESRILFCGQLCTETSHFESCREISL